MCDECGHPIEWHGRYGCRGWCLDRSTAAAERGAVDVPRRCVCPRQGAAS